MNRKVLKHRQWHPRNIPVAHREPGILDPSERKGLADALHLQWSQAVLRGCLPAGHPGRKPSVTNALENVPPTNLSGWQDNYIFAIGDAASGNGRAWEGQIRLMAIYNRALTHQQIIQK